MHTIQDLANGKCAVINDGTLDELNKVLKAAFPLVDEYQYPIQGINKYYHCIPHYKQEWTFTNGEINLPTQSVKDFLKQEIKTNMDNRFPFKLHPIDAQRIINAACSTWKDRLANIFSINIVLNKNIEISEEFYKEMRNACTSEQHKLFDSIFGKDEKYIPEGTPCLVTMDFSNYSLRYSNGKGEHYNNGKKTGDTFKWDNVIILNEEALKNLPVNE